MNLSALTRIGLVAVLLFGNLSCSEVPPPKGLELSEILNNSRASGFKQALVKRPFIFPQDHSAHGQYQNEWWYLTGNVQDDKGRHFGYQVTFFRLALTPPKANGQGLTSAWRSGQLWMAHLAISDVQNQQHVSAQKISRQALGLAGTSTQPFKVWLENWQLSAQGGEAEGTNKHGFPWQLTVQDQAMGLNLSLLSEKSPVLQGEQGLSRKSATAGNASYYYSFSRLGSSGALRLGEQVFQVTGDSWLDREWGSSQLDAGQVGWDWFSIQLNDQQELMYYQLRNRDGSVHGHSQGKWIGVNGQHQTISPSDITLTPIGWWHSPDGKRLPIRWRLEYPAKNYHWLVEALIEDQYMTTLVHYWEGAVRILDAKSRQPLGFGYLEMTGY